MVLVILELEADGQDHPGADIDAYVKSVLKPSAKELSAVHAGSHRGVFDNEVDWAKAHLTEHKLHESVGKKVNGQHVYRITPRGREQLERLKRDTR
ncbi:MAG: winged helix-turn-helix domain-containing protein [Sandaracinaceae bacterium]|nr:winged helix-turn-helix domain-containing protein [Sandaracinaceae bacterium]